MIAVVGATGTIGSAVMRSLSEVGVEGVGFSKSHPDPRRRIDLADERTWTVFPQQPEAVLLCAGSKSAVGVLELFNGVLKLDFQLGKHSLGQPELCQQSCAVQVNVEGPGEFVRFAAKRGCFPVVISTSYVFDGSRPDFGPNDAACPRCEYGRQKVDLEMKLESLSREYAVVRVTKVLGSRNRLLASWKDSLLKGGEIWAAEDVRLSPLPESFAGDAFVSLLRAKRPGMFHLSACDELSWFEIARSLAKRCGVEDAKVKPTGLRNIDPRAEFVPHHGSLSVSWPQTMEAPRSVLAVDRLLENICASNQR